MARNINKTDREKKLQKTIENQRKDLADLKKANKEQKASLLNETEIKKSIRDLTKILDDVQSDKAYTKKPKGSGGTAEDLSEGKNLLKKKGLYSRKELLNL